MRKIISFSRVLAPRVSRAHRFQLSLALRQAAIWMLTSISLYNRSRVTSLGHMLSAPPRSFTFCHPILLPFLSPCFTRICFLSLLSQSLSHVSHLSSIPMILITVVPIVHSRFFSQQSTWKELSTKCPHHTRILVRQISVSLPRLLFIFIVCLFLVCLLHNGLDFSCSLAEFINFVVNH